MWGGNSYWNVINICVLFFFYCKLLSINILSHKSIFLFNCCSFTSTLSFSSFPLSPPYLSVSPLIYSLSLSCLSPSPLLPSYPFTPSFCLLSHHVPLSPFTHFSLPSVSHLLSPLSVSPSLSFFFVLLAVSIDMPTVPARISVFKSTSDHSESLNPRRSGCSCFFTSLGAAD